MSPARGTRGFSLTELLVVITVILTLVSILAVGTKHLLVKSSQLQCQQRMEHIFHGCLMYANQNRGVFPASWDFSRGRAWYETLVQERLLDSDLAIGCPCVDTAVTAGEVGQSPGIPPQVSDTIIKALEWLKAHQAVSGTDNQLGHWGHNGSHNRVEGLPRTPGPTAMGLLCFLGYGCTTTHPPKYADTVTRALRTLLYCQRSDGSFISSSHGAYHSATATMAVCDAYSMMGDLTFHVEGESKSLKDAALRAFSFLCSEQNPNHGGYGYGCCTAGNDVSVGVWAYQGLMSGELSGFARPPSVKNRTATFLSYCLRDNGNWTPYRYTYNSSGYRSNGHDSESRNRMTAASLFIRLAFGGVAGQNDVEAPLNWLKSGDKYLSIAHRTGSNYDIYFVYYMTLALRMLGEPDWSNWKNEFLDNCRERQSADGHWEQTYVPYGQHGGDVYPTMLGCVALEAAVGDYLQGTKWCTAGEHSFGYNKLLGLDCISPAPDTILLMDYTRWGFEREDGAKHLAPRHDDRLNVLFGDGTVLPLTVESLLDDEGKLKEPLTTPQAD